MDAETWVRNLLESPKLIVEPRLAIIMGISNSIIFRRIHEILRHKKPNVDGENWIYRTYANWQAREFPWRNEEVLRTALCYELGTTTSHRDARRPFREPMGILRVRRADRLGVEVSADYDAFASLVCSPAAIDKLQKARERCKTFHRDTLTVPQVDPDAAIAAENLLDSSELAIQPVLAQLIGVNESILLRQLQLSTKMGGKDIFGDGRPWVTHTLTHWQGLCPWVDLDTIGDYFRDAPLRRLILTRRHQSLPGLWYTIDFHALRELIATPEAQSAIRAWTEANSDGPLLTRAHPHQKSGNARELEPPLRAHPQQKSGDAREVEGSDRAHPHEKSGDARELVPPDRAHPQQKSGDAREVEGSDRAHPHEKSGDARELVPPDRAHPHEKSGDARELEPSGAAAPTSSSTASTAEEGEEAKRVLLRGIGDPTLSELLTKPLVDIQDAKAAWDKLPIRKRQIGLLVSFIRRAATTPEVVEIRRHRAGSQKNAQTAQVQKEQTRAEEREVEKADRAVEATIAAMSDEQLLARAKQVLEKYRGNTAVTGTITRKPPRECRLMKMEIVALIQSGQPLSQVNP